MSSIILWISGALCTCSTIGLIYYRNKSLKLSNELFLANKIANEYIQYKSTKRLARYTIKQMQHLKNQNNFWDVILELREVSFSLDESRSKFEIISLYTTDKSNTFSDDIYKEYFLKDLKLKELGIWVYWFTYQDL